MINHKPVLTEEQFKKLQALDTCTASNAIETFKVRLRNEGFANGSIHCQFPHFPPMLGYAATGSIRTSSPPIKGSCYYDRMDFWHYVVSVPAPRVIVLQDVDPAPGVGALVGEIHARICLALNCIGYVTNGSVRDLAAVEAAGFQLFAAGVAVSHAYAHIVEFGEQVEVGGLRVRSGDLIHGDRHGVHMIPESIATEVPKAAEWLRSRERDLIEFCQSPAFRLGEVAKRFESMKQVQPCD